MTKYVCFTCLQESDDSKICTYCGAEIETVDFEKATVIPPKPGSVMIDLSKFNEDAEVFIRDMVSEQNRKYFSNIVIDVRRNKLYLLCNDMEGERIVKTLNDTMKNFASNETQVFCFRGEASSGETN
ncbi:MAG: hypothetical protein OEZ68_21445 [Gammaproteobacteria bacterium]|nr:hypothetical protein [Gammaproteobacteria bacterium]